MVKSTIVYRESAPEQEIAFIDRGYPKKYIFPHKVYCIPKPGPDALRLERWMVGIQPKATHLTLTLHATGEALSEFPGDLFFNKDLVVHQQHFGVPGHLAFASLVSSGKDFYALQVIGDPVQRRARAPAFRQLLSSRFRGWHPPAGSRS